MDNNNKCYCGSNRTYLVDPVKASGHGVDGSFVPPEDLNIYVELTTIKKSRSVITNGDADNSSIISSDEGASKVSFIGGTDNGDGTSSLTTRYTDVSTTFNKTKDTENFGISSIDIGFSSSYAPMITINFVDIRGAALFNTDTGNGPNSEYAAFFQLPYPIFKLTVKGYYGKPVTYCLHLTKWNAKFNTETGNFEIKADFIGYTYAMLTDLLLGYLRAITKTPSGIEKFNRFKEEYPTSERDKIIPIGELLNRIDEINEGVEQLKKGDEVKALASSKELDSFLDRIDKTITNTIKRIVNSDSSSPDGYTAFDGAKIITNEKEPLDIMNQVRNSNAGLFAVFSKPLVSTKPTGVEDIISGFKTDMSSLVKKANEVLPKDDELNEDEMMDVKLFERWIGVNIHNNSLNVLKTEIAKPIREQQNAFKAAFKIESEEEFNEFKLKTKILDKNENSMDFYDFSTILRKVADLKERQKEKDKQLKTDVALKLEKQVTSILGFRPTIKNIIRIFTVHSEVFFECLHEVAKAAQDDISGLRKVELTGLVKNLDLRDTGPIYPWPMYREKSKNTKTNNVLEETWIGKAEGINIPENVPEIVFVEDLLKGLLEVNKEDQQRLIDRAAIGISDSWYPINPLDTPLFGQTQSPYKVKSIGDNNNPIEPLKLLMFRAFTFLGVSNRLGELEDAEIEAMGRLEAHNLAGGVINEDIKKLLIDSEGDVDVETTKIINTFLSGADSNNHELKLNGVKKPFMKEFSSAGINTYEYTFIDDETTFAQPRRFIPINGDFTGKEFYDEKGNFLGKNVTTFPKIAENIISESAPQPDRQDGDTFQSPNSPTNPMVFVSSFFENPLAAPNTNVTQDSATHLKIITKNEYEDTSKYLTPNYAGQDKIFERFFKKMKEGGELLAHVSVDGLYNVGLDKEELIQGWNIFGPSNYSTTTATKLNYGSASDRDQGAIYEGGKEEGTSKAVFYINQNNKNGSTSLCSFDVNGPNPDDFPLKDIKTFGGDEYYKTENGSFTRSFSSRLRAPRHKNLGKTRNLFNDAESSNGLAMVNYVDFACDSYIFSLFGSELYFQQRQSSSPKAARALLFLYTLPWNQMFNDDSNFFGDDDGFNGALFDNAEGSTISNLFSRRAAFIEAPKLWCAWLGGVIWRMDDNDIKYEADEYPDSTPDLVNGSQVPTYEGGSGTFDPIIFGNPITPTDPQSDYSVIYLEFSVGSNDDEKERTNFPKKDQYLTSRDANAALHFTSDGDYKNVDKVIRNLPHQIKEEFKKAFFEFVNGEDWDLVRQNYEIHDKSWDNPDGTITTNPNMIYGLNGLNNGDWWNGTGQNIIWYNIFNTIAVSSNNNLQYGTVGSNVSQTQGISSPINGVTYVKKSILDTSFTEVTAGNKWDNFESFEPIRKFSGYGVGDETTLELIGNYDISYRGKTDGNKLLTRMLTDGVIIVNASYKPWVDDRAKPYNFNKKIAITKGNLETYLKGFVEEYKDFNFANDRFEEEDKAKQTLFNTMDDDTIRQNIYRHCKAVYDKWVAGGDGGIITSCGKPNSKDLDIARAERVTNKSRLIDSFRFVNRAWNDIGDDLLINPNILTSILTENPNQSFYSLLSRVLADNNFNFIPLPAYLDFESPDAVCDLFKAEIFNDTVEKTVSGPTFVCVYTGQDSNKPDLGEENEHPNDGFDFTCDGSQFTTGENTVPDDFLKEKTPLEHNVVAFAVNYGHQNQNIFTDIKLDQSEFTETDESLQITDSIARLGRSTDRTLAGQNLWNIYQLRAYSSEITCLGNVMIQPMMYYQLNNIPMFHGAYRIDHTSHKITPNHMKTTFGGTRTRYVDTPIIEAETLYMSMLGTLTDVETGSVDLDLETTNSDNKASGSGKGNSRATRPPNTVDVTGLSDNINDDVFASILGDKFTKYGYK